MTRFFTTLALVSMLTAALPSATTADNVDQQLALAIAKVCANEAGMASPWDCLLIYQVTESRARADTSRARLTWLRAHSRRVLGDRTCPAGRNCQWTRHLTWSDRRPANYNRRWRPESWQRMRTLAARLVSGEETRRPCPSPPFTWGGSMDRAGALERGMVPLLCENTRNDGYGLP